MKRILALLVLCAMIFSLAACSNPGASSTPADPTEADVSQTADDDKYGGTIHLPIEGDPSTFVAWKISSDIEEAIAPVYLEPLMRCDESGQPQPFLLESLTEDADALTYTLVLKDGIKFHDGSALDAEALKWNIDMYVQEGALASSFYKNVESTEVIDDKTVVIHMSKWDSLLPYAMTRSLYMTSKEAYEAGGEAALEAAPVGTGAFKFESWQHGSSVSFTRFDDYWQGKPYLDGVVLDVYGNSLVIQASMEAGELDAFVCADFDMAKSMEEKGFTLIKSAIPAQAFTLNFNSYDTSTPLGDVNVRKALSHAINKQAIVDALCSGFAQPSNQWALPGNVQYNEDVTGFDYDPEKAKEMLAEAGYADGFELQLTVKSSNTLAVDAAQILSEQLAAVGVSVTLNTLEASNYTTHLPKWDGLLLHPMNIWSSMYSQLSACMAAGVKTGLGVEGFVKVPDIENGIAAAREAGSEEAKELFSGVVKNVYDEYCIMDPIFVTNNVTVVNPKLHDCGIGAITPGYYTLHLAWLEK